MIQTVHLDTEKLIDAAQESLSNKRMTDALTDFVQLSLEILKFVTTAASCSLADALKTDSPFHRETVEELQSKLLVNAEKGISSALKFCRIPAEV